MAPGTLRPASWGRIGMAILRGRRISLNLALQGGGAHGAFTWGVLDRLLEEPALRFEGVSATSAGAVNAVAMADGLARGGAAEARQGLAEMWGGIYKTGVPEFLRFNPLLEGITRVGAAASASVAHFTAMLSPYELNPLGINPLERLLTNRVDFERLRATAPPRLFIAATETATGRARIFRHDEITLEVVLASACLPTVHRAVEIDGVHYWDGGFSANPDLVTLVRESRANDTLLVQLNPTRHDALPTTAREIHAQLNRITFNQPLLRDVALIATCRQAGCSLVGPGKPHRRLARHRFHLIEAAPYTAKLSPESKMKPDWGLMTRLFEAGRHEAERWLEAHGKDLGKRESVDLAAHFLGEHAAR